MWTEGANAALQEVRLLDLRTTELLQLLQPAAQHRLDALVHLRDEKLHDSSE